MFTSTVVSALLFASSALAGPIRLPFGLVSRSNFGGSSPSFSHGQSISFNNYGGFSNMGDFDNFFGSNDFSGSETHVVVEKEETIVCESIDIRIIQQQLVILREFAKRIITEQICEVEVQTIVLEQHISGFNDFSSDILRQSSREVSFDSSISDYISHLVNNDGSLSSSDFGFSGSDVGAHSLVVQGNNWNDNSSPASVGKARHLSKLASGGHHSNNSSSSSLCDLSNNSSSSTDLSTSTDTSTDTSTSTSTVTTSDSSTTTSSSDSYSTVSASATATSSAVDSVATADPAND